MKHSTYTSYEELPLMLSVAEVAAVLGISRAGAYELARSSGFPALKIGSRIVILCANEAAEQNREAYQCGVRNSNGITQPSGAATPRDSDAHERIAVPQALRVLREHTRPRPKSGKVCRSDTRPRRVSELRKTLRG